VSVFDDLLRTLGGGQYTDLGTPEALAPIPTRLRTGGALGEAGQPAGWSYPDYALQHLDDVLSGKVAKQGVLGQNNYDPNQSFAQNALNPAAIEQATEIAGGIGTGAIRAYHGSPHSFDRFDLSKIGTGEGAQTYGHGLYFAEREPVARGYRDVLASRPTGLSDPGYDVAQYWLKESGGNSDAALKAYLDYAGPHADTTVASYLKKPPGHMYEVDIHADPKAFLQYEKQLREHPPQVQEALRSIPWGEPYLKSSFTGGEIKPMSAVGANELREAGIPGIRYLDQGSRGAGEGTSNYAIFDPRIIEILRKYGILPPIAAGGGLLATGSEPPT
jgi:hypothetical protein